MKIRKIFPTHGKYKLNKRLYNKWMQWIEIVLHKKCRKSEEHGKFFLTSTSAQINNFKKRLPSMDSCVDAYRMGLLEIEIICRYRCLKKSIVYVIRFENFQNRNIKYKNIFGWNRSIFQVHLGLYQSISLKKERNLITIEKQKINNLN